MHPRARTDAPAGGASAAAPGDSRTGVFSGTGIGSGAACGPAVFSLTSLEDLSGMRIEPDQVPAELARLDSVARAARVSLVRQRESLSSHFTEEQRQVFDAQLKMLEDPTIEADVRERIEQGMSLEGAVLDALQVYERLFEVVESEKLRNRVSDMRDVALRLLRHCERPSARRRQRDLRGGVLVVRELGLSDLTEALEHGAVALVAEAGRLDTHGAILTRASGLPALLGVGEIRSRLRPGDRILVDADLGQAILNPPEDQVRAVLDRRQSAEDRVVLEPVRLGDGSRVELRAAVASPSEARRAVALGAEALGLYRTDLPVLQRRGRPRLDSLTQLYRQVVQACPRVTWRLPDLDASCGIQELYPETEPNPALGLRGCRLLLERPELLRTQMQAILRACAGHEVRIAAPFVSDLADLRSLREAVDNAREEERLEGVATDHPIQLGVVFETPSAALLVRELLGQADFGLVGLDNLAQHLLAADRGSPYGLVAGRLQEPHPALLRALRKIQQVAEGLGKELVFYGESLAVPAFLPLLLGVGARTFAVGSVLLRDLPARLGDLDPDTCQRVAESACHAGSQAELLALLPASWRSGA